ncbi:PREDICTED: pre-rRNA-processing protein esf1 [Theobroma cacao]|uniref:Pre-rRNA-processing protein esf1 n=1 Tax=Theobroma cacao TaxID=3641 RepID=A0AB32WV41_THECC|nr:PREDICTED: pre-rRNA-processing protein esf1 [Theobroma cacao]XP_017981624.1 PREDICTED: pre-rRNA-processing protein esf1 [Theobroma cacao]
MGSKNKGQKAKSKTRNKNKPDSILSLQGSNSKKNGSGSGKIITDARFASLHSDPRFQKVAKHKTKVVIDSRFNRMFSDKRFSSSSAPLDKRGKPKKENSQSSLRHYYHLEDKEEEKRKKDVLSGGDDSEEVDEESESSEISERDSDGESEEEEGSESGSTTEEEDIDIIYEDGEPEMQEENVPMIEKETRRLAVVNMDWRHVKAVDLYVMLSSFLPKDGQIMSVAVYPSEFGLRRMKEEEIHGPVGLFDDENEENDEVGDDEIDNEKLRAYERSRLRYYYAVVECDSSATADYLYKACDGAEFERSSNVLDLRFIPDSMEFKHSPRDVATEAPANYEGLNFHTQALQQSKIHLSWDEDEPQRGKILKRKFNAEQLAELELKEFLASDESESDDDENEDTTENQSDKKNKKRDIYCALLQSGDGSDGDGEDNGQDMEVTFNTGLEDISKRILEKKDKEAETVWEVHLRKRREKKKSKKNKSKDSSEDESHETDIEATEEPDDFFVEESSFKRSKKEGKQHEDMEKEAEASRAELELLLTDDKGADTGLKGYNLKPKEAKGKKGKEVLDEEKIPIVDDDPRFSALFTSPLYALDPTNPQFKRSATYARQIAKKLQKGEQKELAVEDMKMSANSQFPSDDPGMNKVEQEKSHILPSKEKHALSSMVRSVKMKLKQVQLPSDSKMPKKSVSGMGRKQEQHLVHSMKKTKVLRK